MKHTRDEDGCAEGQFLSLIKEAQIERNAREPSLSNAQQDAQCNEHRIRDGNGLQRRRYPPRHDQHRDVDVRRDELPQERHPFECNVRNVKGRERPFVPVVARGVGLQVFVHAGDARVADIWAFVSLATMMGKCELVEERRNVLDRSRKLNMYNSATKSTSLRSNLRRTVISSSGVYNWKLSTELRPLLPAAADVDGPAST